MRQVFRHGDGTGGTCLFAQAAADAGDLAVFAGVFAQVFVGALDDDRVRALVDMDEFARAFAHAGAAGDTLAFVHLCHTKAVYLDRVKFAHADAKAARDAAVFAICRCAAAAVAGHERGLIGKAFFDSHTHTFLSYGVCTSGRTVLRSWSYW